MLSGEERVCPFLWQTFLCSNIIELIILLATGFWFDGYKSGMTISGAYYISKFTVKIFQLFNSLFDKIMELVVKIEFMALGIDKK